MSEPDPYESAIETAEDLSDDLKVIAESDLPFARDAKSILAEVQEDE